MRAMFGQVEALLRPNMLSAASSVVAERSFSSLRHLKTYLRTTMTQERLNSLLVCQVHAERTSKLDDRLIAKKFIETLAAARTKVFGKIN